MVGSQRKEVPTGISKEMIVVTKHCKHDADKVAKRDTVPDKRFSRKSAADNVVKQALAAWGDSSSESEEKPNAGSISMMAMQNQAKEYDSLFALMAQSDEDEEDDNDELGDDEKSKDDLMIVVVDLKKTIENLSKEKNTLVENIAATEQERDDMVVSIEDLREQVEEVTREHNLLKEQTKKWMDNTEREEVAREAQLELESELKNVKTMVLVTKMYKNIYVADFDSLQAGDMSCLKKDLARGLPKSNFKEHRADMMSQMKEASKYNVTSSSTSQKEPGTLITTTEAKERDGDATLGTPNAEHNSGSHNFVDVNDDSYMEEPGPSNPEVQISNYKQKSSHSFKM
uniref:Myosin-1-like n=1 Tax=Nicotiana sylvestris TaxID=4096 RepID=A0A1U7VFS2_NICSY|nr:PREDICTED: myosin-1-like [Nicotiana sylvestris]